MWQTVVLIPKGKNGDFRVIRLVGVIWKTVSSLLSCQHGSNHVS